MAGMYRTHEFHPKNSKDFNTIGDPYDKKRTNNSTRAKGRQFQTEPPKMGQTAGYFAPYTYAPSAYQDNQRYLQREAPSKRKLGFGSHDAMRRDEFTLDIRARQWKEKLRGEQVYVRSALEASRDNLPPMTMDQLESEKERQMKYTRQYADRPDLFQTQVPFNLYDIGRDQVTRNCHKCARETFYCPHRVGRGEKIARRPETAPTTSQIYGKFDGSMPLQTQHKPRFGKVNQRKHFYDNSHLAKGW